MKPQADERRALARESRKVRTALDQLAALALPKRREAAPAAFVPQLTPTDSLAELSFDDMFEYSEFQEPAAVPTSEVMRSVEPQRPVSLANLDDFFNDLNMSEEAEHTPTEEIAIDSFSPGTGEDLFEGFGSESDLEAKMEQETLSFTARADGDATPPEGYPPLNIPEHPAPTESINDLLDGFDW